VSIRDKIAMGLARAAASVGSWTWRGGRSGGNGFDGSKIRGSLRSAYPSSAELDHTLLRNRSRAAFWDSSQGGAILQRLADNVIGTGLQLEASPLWDLIGKAMEDETKRRQWARDVELRFWAWASSTEPDSAGRRSLFELMGFAYLNELRDGECPTILRYSGDSTRTSPISLQFVDPDQIDNPMNSVDLEAINARGNVVADGVELTKYGELVAIHILDPYTRKTTRIPVWGEARRFVIMPALLDLPGQIRGVGILAPVIHELQKITDYELCEIEAALVNAVIAAYIKPSAESDTRSNIAAALGSGASLRGSTSTGSSGTSEPEEKRITKPGLFIQNLKAGEDITSFDTKRPNVNFDAFISAITKHVSARLSIPVETLEMKFSSNYSASRAALIMFWQTIDRGRMHFSTQFLQPIYEAWLAEEIKAKRISAPGYGRSPLMTRAWVSTSWLGQSMPSIDPVKDAQADDARIAQGSTTRERVALKYNGSDFFENAERQKRELEMLPAAPAAPVPPQLNTTQLKNQRTSPDGEDGEKNNSDGEPE